jgi:hypothetical protein
MEGQMGRLHSLARGWLVIGFPIAVLSPSRTQREYRWAHRRVLILVGGLGLVLVAVFAVVTAPDDGSIHLRTVSDQKLHELGDYLDPPDRPALVPRAEAERTALAQGAVVSERPSEEVLARLHRQYGLAPNDRLVWVFVFHGACPESDAPGIPAPDYHPPTGCFDIEYIDAVTGSWVMGSFGG